MHQISRKDILQQLKDDLIGKDSFRGVTLTYSWLANQFGHISLGFIPTYILQLFLLKKPHGYDTGLTAAFIISGFWLVFETYNFLGPLLLKRQSTSKIMYVPGKTRFTFKPRFDNIAFDTITDLGFFWFGAFLAGLLCSYTTTAVVILIVLVLALIHPVSYWFLTKILLQNAQYPYQARLAQWDFKIEAEDGKTVNEFLNLKNKGIHLFIMGAKVSGKTRLGVGIATELSILGQECLYTSAMKLYSMFFESKKQSASFKKYLWTWREAQVIVIDDINPGMPITTDIVNPALFKSYIDTFLPHNTGNRELLKSKNVIWILGSDDERQTFFKPWQQMLLDIGIEKSKIRCIHLPDNGVFNNI